MSNSISTPPRKSYICVCVSVFPPRSREQPSCEPCASMLSAASYPTQHHHYILIGQRGRGELHPQSAYNSQNRPESYSLKGIGQTWLLRRAVACRTSFLKGAFFFRIISDLEDASALQRLAFIFIVIMEMLSFILSYIRKKGDMQ